MVTFLVGVRTGSPLSVAVKVTTKIEPLWLGLGEKEKVPEAGFPVAAVKLIPVTRPVAFKATVLSGTSPSVALTWKVTVELTIAVMLVGAEMTGGVLTSFTIIVTDFVSERGGAALSVAENRRV